MDEALLQTDILDPSNANLSLPQKELLGWHNKLGHYNLSWVQKLARPRKGDDAPLIPMRYPSASSTPPTAIKCHACRLGKSVRTPDGTHLDKDITRFGSKVATDQFVSSVKGRRFETRGKEADGQKFAGGTIFVDLSSGYVEVHPQVSLNVAETIASNRRFERMLNIHGPDVHHYLGDNGVY